MSTKVPRVSVQSAREQGRCACGGCPTCNAKDGSACGIAVQSGAFCRWCKEYQR